MCSPDKILIVSPFPPNGVGGAETFLIDLAKALKGTVHICTIKWKKPILWKGMDFLKTVYLVYKLFIPLLKMRIKYKYKRVYALGLIPTFLCCILRIKFSTVILALYDFKKPNWFTFFVDRAEKVYVEGLKGKEDMVNLGIPEEKIVLFQHWCDQIQFFYKPKNNKAMRVLFVGRPIFIKGKHIVEQCQAMTTGIDYEYIENVPYKKLPKHYQMADVVVVPSLYSEGFSRVVIESASCGCALVTSNRGALPELVAKFGKVIEPTPLNLAEAMNNLKNNREALEKIQLATAIYAQTYFSSKNAEVFL